MTRSPWSFEEEHRAAIEEALRSGTVRNAAGSVPSVIAAVATAQIRRCHRPIPFYRSPAVTA